MSELLIISIVIVAVLAAVVWRSRVYVAQSSRDLPFVQDRKAGGVLDKQCVSGVYFYRVRAWILIIVPFAAWGLFAWLTL